MLKENLFCPNNASETYMFISWQHQKLLLVANQLQDSTFLFEINSEGTDISNLKSQLKVIAKFIVYIGLSLTPKPPHFFQAPSLKSANCPRTPPFLGNSLLTVKLLLFKNLVEGSTHPLPPPPAEREEGCTLWIWFELIYDDTMDMNTII